MLKYVVELAALLCRGLSSALMWGGNERFMVDQQLKRAAVNVAVKMFDHGDGSKQLAVGGAVAKKPRGF